ncbi:MAG: zf-TFIIB domain-containing protein [Deltaproteobacteria bacterium]|nr:zf-TFIIB domain-containing protein [Deltaproteobacteria bacterium]
MTTKPEEEYFARLEAEKKRKIAEAKRTALATVELIQLKAAHWMHCPKCGLELEEIVYRGVRIDKCFHCGGVYLDNGELEKLSGGESHFWDSILSLFKS